MPWKEELTQHFSGRPQLPLGELAREFGIRGEHAEEAVKSSLEVFQQEYGVPIGLLRPTDSLQLFTEPPPSRNPISWFFRRAAFEDSTSELNYTLKKRRKVLGQPIKDRPLTVRDYVLAWVGQDNEPSLSE